MLKENNFTEFNSSTLINVKSKNAAEASIILIVKIFLPHQKYDSPFDQIIYRSNSNS
jgi:hypothetical protein